MLKIETIAPNFELKDQFGESHTLKEHQDSYVLVYFYPKDDTPGCTKEACVIRDMYQDFESNGVKVFGISADSVESHKSLPKNMIYLLLFYLIQKKKLLKPMVPMDIFLQKEFRICWLRGI